jgi:hypothetical protein
MEFHEVDTKEKLDRWAQTLGVPVRVVDETWSSITYRAECEFNDGTTMRCQYRYVLPRPLANRRRERTYVVGLVHEVNGAECVHVRPVIGGLSADCEADAMHQAILYASAMVEVQRRHVCGARAVALSAYTVQRAAEWQGVT